MIRYARTYNLNIYYQKSSINSLDKRIHMTVRFLHLHFKFTFTFTFHPFTTTEYYLLLLLLLLSPHNLFTFLLFYLQKPFHLHVIQDKDENNLGQLLHFS